MRYSVNSEVFNLNPQLQFGNLIGKGLKNTDSSSEDIARLRTAEELRNHPTVQSYRSTM